MDPHDAVVAVIGPHAETGCTTLLGTGSLIGDGSVLLTAAHVGGDEVTVASLRDDDGPQAYPARLIERDGAHDLALYRVEGYRAEKPLTPWWAPITFDRDLVTFEYSPSAPEGDQLVLSPATRIGHMTRMIDVSDRYGPRGEWALELSFPAVGGASGAPVMLKDDLYGIAANQRPWSIVGVITGNIAHHLLPLQVDEYLGADNSYVSETRYMLPQGLAVNIAHLSEMYERHIGPAEDPQTSVWPLP
ncbi:serine protease [Williamsia herbipolensis]|uniref:Serine protease n=1 Tax=Williamsia herbipolensis TaxID=1603258 RepID=A0AAU4K360_9NOCA|nr:serine protease [Williamsia herbipolensis]